MALRRLGVLDLDDRAVRDGDPVIDPADQLRSRREVRVPPGVTHRGPGCDHLVDVAQRRSGCIPRSSIGVVIRSCSARYELVDSRPGGPSAPEAQ